MKKALRTTALILSIFALMLTIAACDQNTNEITDKAYYDYNNSDTGKGTDIRTSRGEKKIDTYQISDFVASDKESDYILIKIKNYGDVVVLLRSDVAPVTVANFKKLVKEKFYDGTAFHRVIEHFMIQGGGSIVVPDKDGKGTVFEPKESSSILGEFTSNGFENNLRHVRGVISMARANDKNSASSQFFIIHESNESSAYLNGNYAAFGYVLAGMDVVDKIATCKVLAADTDAPVPIEDVIIESATFVEPK